MKVKKFKILSHFWLHARTQKRNLILLLLVVEMWQLENQKNASFFLAIWKFLLTKLLNLVKKKFEAHSNVMKCMVPYNLTFDISNFDYVTTLVMCRVRGIGKCIPKIRGLG